MSKTKKEMDPIMDTTDHKEVRDFFPLTSIKRIKRDWTALSWQTTYRGDTKDMNLIIEIELIDGTKHKYWVDDISCEITGPVMIITTESCSVRQIEWDGKIENIADIIKDEKRKINE